MRNIYIQQLADEKQKRAKKSEARKAQRARARSKTTDNKSQVPEPKIKVINPVAKKAKEIKEAFRDILDPRPKTLTGPKEDPRDRLISKEIKFGKKK